MQLGRAIRFGAVLGFVLVVIIALLWFLTLSLASAFDLDVLKRIKENSAAFAIAGAFALIALVVLNLTYKGGDGKGK